MLDAFNEIIGPYGEEFREELFRWAGTNEKNGPVFANLTVTFVDDDDTVIKTVTEVYAGEDITSKAPALPSRDSFTTAWDRDFTNVQESMTVQAVYTEIPEPPSSDPGSDRNQSPPPRISRYGRSGFHGCPSAGGALPRGCLRSYGGEAEKSRFRLTKKGRQNGIKQYKPVFGKRHGIGPCRFLALQAIRAGTQRVSHEDGTYERRRRLNRLRLQIHMDNQSIQRDCLSICTGLFGDVTALREGSPRRPRPSSFSQDQNDHRSRGEKADGQADHERIDPAGYGGADILILTGEIDPRARAFHRRG